MTRRSAGISRRRFNRNSLSCGIGSLLAGWSSPAFAPGMLGKEWSPWIDPPSFGMGWPRYTFWGPWKFIPSIVILSEPRDPRIPAVHAAVGFWNNVFLNLGSSFRLGRVGHIADRTTADDARRNFHRDLDKVIEKSRSGLEPLGFITSIEEHVVVLLSARNRSFAGSWRQPRRGLAVIEALRTYQSTPPSTPSGSEIENIAAHELGHILGLHHNDDEGSLMCGPCEPSVGDGFRLLTDKDKSQLIQMYPRRWRAES
jgi:Matrixin